MKILLVIKDAEYSQAFQNKIASADKNILVEVNKEGKLKGLDKNTIIVSDVDPKKVERKLLRQTVFLSKNPNDIGVFDKEYPYNMVFKYLRIPQILSYIEEVEYSITGETERIDSAQTRVYSVCSNSNSCDFLACKALARQIMYRHGGEILLLPLRYINEYYDINDVYENDFSRLMYNIKSDKKYRIESFVYKDNYGINYVNLPRGINPICELKSEELIMLLKVLCHGKFSTVILDIGDCFSKKNIAIANKSDNVIFLDASNRLSEKDIFQEDKIGKKLNVINIGNNDEDIEIMIDEYVKQIYEVEGKGK